MVSQRRQSSTSASLNPQPKSDMNDKALVEMLKGPEPTFLQAIRNMMIDSADNIDFGGIHIQDWDDAGKAMFLIVLWYAVYFTALFYFTYTLTQAGVVTEYLSLVANTSDQTCFAVPLTVSGTFEGDIHGNWQTSPNFQQNLSAFQIIMTGSAMSNDEYTAVMTNFSNSLRSLSSRASNRDLSWSGIMWSMFVFNDDATKLTFSSTGETERGFYLSEYFRELHHT
jgi:hypothetical protein